jgi:hypothetical protein
VTREVVGPDANTGLLVDQTHRIITPFSDSGKTYRVYQYQQLIRSEVLEDGDTVTSTVRSSQIIGGLVGNAVLGPVGLLVGGLTGKTRTRQEVRSVALGITVDDSERPLWSIQFLPSNKPFLKKSKEAQAAHMAADEAHALVSVLLRQADDDAKRAIIAQRTQVEPNQTPCLPLASAMEVSLKKRVVGTQPRF